jgi:hypothetical protein
MIVHTFRQIWLLGLMSGALAISGISQELNPRFVSARASGTVFVMELAGIGDASCVLEATEDLLEPWTEVALTPPLADGELEVPVDRPKRFFRVRCGAVYSPNEAGYLQVELPAGYGLIANPFDCGRNTVAEVLGEAWAIGTTVYQFDASRQAYTATQFGDGAWLNPGERLSTGTGAFIHLATLSTLVLGGLTDRSATHPELEGGWNLVGPPVAASSIVPEDGDRIVILAADNSYQYYSFDFGEWEPAVPSVRLGEGFWYYRNDPGAIPPAGGCLLFSNFGPALGSEFGAPQFDHVGCLIEGTNWLAQLYAGPDAGALAGVGEPVTFLSGDEAGFFNTGSNAVRYVESVTPGGLAVMQIKMWMASNGATFEEARANGGPTGMTTTLSVFTSGGGAGGIPPSLPAGLVGLTSSGGLGSVIPDVSGGGSYFVGGTARFNATYDYVTSRTVTYRWQRGTPEQIVPDDSGGWIWIPGSWVDIDGATGPVLELSPIRFEDADHYRVWLHIEGCGGGGASFPVELQVLPTHSLSEPSIDPATGAFRFVLEAESTFDFIIEYSSDLVVWNPLRTVVKPVDPVEIEDTGAPGNQQRFYRARALTLP